MQRRGFCPLHRGAGRNMLTKGCVATGAGCGKEKEADFAPARRDATRQKSATGISLAFLFLVRHRSDWTTSLGRQPAGDRGRGEESMMDIAGVNGHIAISSDVKRNQGPMTRTSLLRHQLSRRKPPPVQCAQGVRNVGSMEKCSHILGQVPTSRNHQVTARRVGVHRPQAKPRPGADAKP